MRVTAVETQKDGGTLEVSPMCCPLPLMWHRRAMCGCLCSGKATVVSNCKNKKFHTLCSISLQQGWIWTLGDETHEQVAVLHPSCQAKAKGWLSCVSFHLAAGHSSETGKKQSFIHPHDSLKQARFGHESDYHWHQWSMVRFHLL